MKDVLSNSLFFGVMISVLSYETGLYLKKRFCLRFLNPLLFAIVVIVALLLVFHIDYSRYSASAKYLSYLLTPATVCLAIPLYEQLSLLKENWKAIFAGIFAGVMTSLTSVFVLAQLFGFSHREYITMLPKSITTAIGMSLSKEMGGMVTITVISIVITGVLGNVLAETVCRLFRITDPVARGIGIGTASHAIGTTKALEMGEIEGAMSSLSVAVAGLLTVILASFYAELM